MREHRVSAWYLEMVGFLWYSIDITLSSKTPAPLLSILLQRLLSTYASQRSFDNNKEVEPDSMRI